MREAFTTFVNTEPFPVNIEGDLTVTSTDKDANKNIQIDVKNHNGQTLGSDAQLSSYCISRIAAAHGEPAVGSKFYIRTVLIARDLGEPNANIH